jgi:hypothetical protein
MKKGDLTMKKIITTLALLCILSALAFGQMINTRQYVEIFGHQNGQINLRSNYIWAATDDDIEKFGALNFVSSTMSRDDTRIITDTPLEFALLTYYSSAVRNIRPAQADAILPANNPRLSDQKLGAAVFQEIQILRFLGDTAAVNRHEAVLQYIIGRGNATRTEIETFYRNNIRALVSQVVDEEFNKISFLLENAPKTRGGNTVLTRNPQNGHYELSCTGYFGTNTMHTKTFSGSTLDALLDEMRRDRDNFDQTGINAVRAQAALIPAVALSSSVINDSVNLITAFYLNPSLSTLNALRGRHRTFSLDDGDRGRAAAGSFIRTINELNPVIADRVVEVAQKCLTPKMPSVAWRITALYVAVGNGGGGVAERSEGSGEERGRKKVPDTVFV